MYLNDHARASFYESLGLDTTQFNRCGVPCSMHRAPLLSLLFPKALSLALDTLADADVLAACAG
jgi:hypothetical protein